MKMFGLNVACLLFIVNYTYGELSVEEPFTENGVYVLNQNNFYQFLSAHSVVLVEFYAPWCGHCKSFAPVYSEAAQELIKNDPPIPLAKVDATVEKELANKYNINGYPTLIYFKNGQHYDLEADRSSQSIIKFMKNVNSANWSPPKNYVITLTKENFTNVLEHTDYILVEFFAPWCGHCKSLAPEYEKAAKILSKHEQPIVLAAVDATQETELAQEYGVTGYPTLKLFRNGKVRDYNGPRYSDGIVEWMIKNRENAAKEIKTKSELNNIKNPEKVLVMGFFQSKNDKLYPIFIDATNRLRDEILSAFTFNENLHKMYDSNLKDSVGLVLLLKPEYFSNRHELDYVKYIVDGTVEPTVDLLVSFIEEKMFPLVGEYNSQTSPFYQRYPKDYLCLFFFTVDFTVHHRSATMMWLKKIIEISVKYQEKIQFAIADDDKQAEKLKELRLDDSGEDMNVGCINRENVKYRMNAMDEFDRDHIMKFLDDMLEGKLFPLLKSAPVPKITSSVIKHVVGDTYKKLINDDPSDGIILLYRSPCETCEKFRNFLIGLSSKHKSESLNIFSMDLSVNELPPISGLDTVDSRPSLYFIKSLENHSEKLLKKKLLKFSGEQLKEEDIELFVAKSSEKMKEEL